MDEDIATDWPAQEDEAEPSLDDVIPEGAHQLDVPRDDETEEDNDPEVTSTEGDKASTEWSFPVRAAPILALQCDVIVNGLFVHILATESFI